MKRIIILAVICLSSVCLIKAQSFVNGSKKQNSLLKDTILQSIEDSLNYFPSCFRKIDSGKFNGFVSGDIKLETTGHKEQRAIANVSSSLQIEYDKNKVYDNSYKTYHFKANGMTFSYTTYQAANKLIIMIDGKQFERNLIDGDCHHRILGVDFKYTTLKSTETLTLWVSKPVGLFQAAKRQYLYNHDAVLLPGTKLVFTIERKPVK